MTDIIVHCSDAPNGRMDRASDIHRWHLERGWSGIGYNYFIGCDGKAEAGRPLYWDGAHCRGHNEKIGICLAGKNEFTSAQEESLQHLLADLSDGYLDDISVMGHYQYDDKKTCPNFDVEYWFVNGFGWPTLEE